MITLLHMFWLKLHYVESIQFSVKKITKSLIIYLFDGTRETTFLCVSINFRQNNLRDALINGK